MTRVILALVFGAAVVMLGAGLLLPSQCLLAAGVALMLGLGVRHGDATQKRERRSVPETSRHRTLHPQLLDVALNEMREGVVVIDTDMRVVASNRAALNALHKGRPKQSG
jgi:PAS domain-containing protein